MTPKKRIPIPTLSSILSICLLWGASGLVAEVPGSDGSVKLYTMGNSLTANLRASELANIVNEHTDQRLTVKRTGIPGTPINYLWANKADEIKKIFDEGGWDAATIQPFLRPLNKDIGPSLEILKSGLAENPKLQLYIYAQWSPRSGDDYSDLWLQDASILMGDDPGGLDSGGVRLERTKMYYEGLTQALREEQPEGSKPVRLFPVGHAWHILDQKAKVGILPGFMSASEFSSDFTHSNNVGSFVAAMTLYAVLYGESPVGLPAGDFRGSEDNPRSIVLTDEQIRIIQESAWEAVTASELSGVKGSGSPRVLPQQLPPVVVGEPYRHQLLAGRGRSPYKWLDDKKLPAGLELTPNGVLQGMVMKSTGAVSFRVVATGADGQVSDPQSFQLNVQQDSAPRITTDRRIDVSLGDYVETQITAEDGNGRLKWKAGNGLPYGLTLNSSGILSGAPGETGEFEVKVTVTDGDLGEAETDSSTLTILVGEPTSLLLRARRMDGGAKPDIDGDPSDSVWKLKSLPLKTLTGQPIEAMYDFVYTRGHGRFYGVVVVRDEDVVTDSDDPTQDDSIEVLIDGKNDRQVEFNADDRHFIRSLGSELQGVLGIKNRYQLKVKEIEQGWAAEFRVDSNDLKAGAFEPGKTFGFDLQINDDDDGNERDAVSVLSVGSTEGEDMRNWAIILLDK